jgi:hypothetical protein
VELQKYESEFKKKGLGVVAIMYDSPEILADFAKRKGITFPMLSDPGSKIIKAFGVLNTNVPAGDMQYGIPFPGTFIVDSSGVIKSKYFEDIYQDRYSAPTILLKEFGSPSGTKETSVSTAHLDMHYYSTQDEVRPNLHFTLVSELALKPKMHVYSPTVKDFIPIEMEINPSPLYKASPPAFPKAENLYLEPIQQTVAVYRGKFRITQDVTLAGNDALQAVLSGNHMVKITGKLKYQACDDQVCYIPQTVPMTWTLNVNSLDRERVPEAIQHKAQPAKK